MFKQVKHFIFGIHDWKTTHVNKWFIPTRQVCRICGMSRHVEHRDSHNTKIARNPFWIYSDGTEEPDTRVFNHV